MATLLQMVRRPRSLRVLAGWFAGLVVAAGVLGGLLWHAMVTLPTYSVSDNGSAQITERALGQVFATDGFYLIIGMLAGLAIGFTAWSFFRNLGWPVALVAVAGGLISGLICWGTGVLQGPRNFADRITAAQPGQLVPIDFQLHTMPALFIWALGAIIPVMLYANLSREEPLEPRRSRTALAKPRELDADPRSDLIGDQLD